MTTATGQLAAYLAHPPGRSRPTPQNGLLAAGGDQVLDVLDPHRFGEERVHADMRQCSRSFASACAVMRK